MADCPHCKDNTQVEGLLPGEETTCFWCGKKMINVLPAVSRAKPASPGYLKTHPSKTSAVSRMPVTQQTEDHDDEMEGGSFLHRLFRLDPVAAGALFCGCMAFLFASLPYVNMLTKPLSAIGLLIAIVGCLLPAFQKQSDVWLPGVISALCLFVLLFVGSWPKGSPSALPARASVPLNQEEGVGQHIDEGSWVDASTHAFHLHDLEAKIISARVEGVDLNSEAQKNVTPEKYLVIRMLVKMNGVVFKYVPYEPWADSAKKPSAHQPLLTDDQDRTYHQKTFAGEGKLGNGGDRPKFLTPGRSFEEILVFPVPPANMEYLRLKLSATALGQSGDFQLQIPRSMLEDTK
jgi:hypothetical protein